MSSEPTIVVWCHSSADSSVADTTYFGIALSRSAIGPVWSRQARARPCQVSRGSSSASAASARSSAPCRPASLMYGKSASAGGASMTPSSVAWVCAVIEVMRVRPPAAAQLIAAHESGARAGPHARSSTPYPRYRAPWYGLIQPWVWELSATQRVVQPGGSAGAKLVVEHDGAAGGVVRDVRAHRLTRA